MHSLIAEFERLVLARPWLSLLLVFAVCAGFAAFTPRFQLDASADSLLLEADPDLRYYRVIRSRYGSDDYLIVTYTVGADTDLFSDRTLATLQGLRDRLAQVSGVAAVTTILDVPLIASPPVTLEELQDSVPTLLSARTDRELARRELTESVLYRELLMSLDGRTTALLVTLQDDQEFEALLRERDQLWVTQLEQGLTPAEQAELDTLDDIIQLQRRELIRLHRQTIAEVRVILADYRHGVEIFLGGLPMIVVDMLDYVLRDVIVFGAGILVFLVGLLVLIFRRPRWVLLPLVTCMLSALVMTGFLGLARWPVTVVSANFVALLLIFCLSLTVHLIIRYQELHADNPGASQRWLITETTKDKWQPCAYTAATTMVAFASLLISGIRPVIDFGWLMVIGMGVVLLMSFTLFPAGLMLVEPGEPQRVGRLTDAITRRFAAWIERQPRMMLLVYGVIAALAVFGLTRLEVENRFIDNFKEDTEIYQGLVTIDRQLGGTTPLDIILDADPAFFAGPPEPEPLLDDEFAGEMDEFDAFEDEFAEPGVDGADDLGATSYWYNSFQLGRVGEIHDYLESQPETGKVLSMDTVMDTFRVINNGDTPDTFFMSLLYKNVPDDIKAAFFDPYLSRDGNQLRLSIRVFESDPNLRRQALLERVRDDLIAGYGLEPDQLHLTGMLVLYNNVLQSLYRSQILTLGFVFVMILGMFILLFRSLKVGLVALVPNLLAATVVLGAMGLTGVPLDIMTITIAAITVGIGVDDSIHYVHRFKTEFAAHKDYGLAMRRSHASIGRAMYYTSIIIAAGFSILVLSNFLPTIFFGLFTSLAMLFAMVANLTLLPLLLLWFRPLGPGSDAPVTQPQRA